MTGRGVEMDVMDVMDRMDVMDGMGIVDWFRIA